MGLKLEFELAGYYAARDPDLGAVLMYAWYTSILYISTHVLGSSYPAVPTFPLYVLKWPKTVGPPFF